jgi:putative transposase
MRVEQHIIKHNHQHYELLESFLHASKNLYNYALYKTRQAFFNNEKIPRLNELDKDKNVDYRSMPTAQSAQQTLKLVEQAWTGYFASIKSYNDNPEKFNGKPRLPNYLDKDGNQVLIIATPLKERNGILPFPKTFLGFTIKRYSKYPAKQVRFIPRNRHIVCEIIYEAPDVEQILDNNRYYGIDLGLDNFATVASNTGSNPYIINGKGLKSINQYYNKQKAHYQEVAQRMNNKKITNRMLSITDKRNAQVRDFIHKASRKIIDNAIENDISVIVVGKNDGWKQDINIGKRNNQNFVQIPHSIFIDTLTYKAKSVGINVITVEESYTSKTSFLDGEMPVKHDIYAGKRVKRGLFKSSSGKLINSDVNGALQILKKSKPNAYADGVVGIGLYPAKVSIS